MSLPPAAAAVAWLAYAAVELATGGAIVRRVWAELTCLLIRLDLACVRLVQLVVRPRYVIAGKCDRRGVCCQHIVGDPPRLVKRTALLAAYAWWHRVAHRFEVVARGPNEELIFSCGHLRSDGRCGIYRLRPRLCRNYPLVPFFGTPRLLPGCGYRVVPRVVAGMRRRASLPIVNAAVAVHHPTPPPRPAVELESARDYHLVAVPPAAPGGASAD